MLTHELKDYLVYRVNRTGDVFQCHKWRWESWVKNDQVRDLTMLVNNVTLNEAWRFCQLTRED